MINAAALLRDLKRLTTTIESDLREQLTTTPDLDASLDNEWQAARNVGRMAATLHDFKEEAITQAAVHWLLMGVFIRFLEDNGLIDRPWLSAASPARRALAQDRHESYFRAHPGDSDLEYLLAAYRDVGRLPGLGPLFDERHNPLFRLAVSGDGAMAIVGFWQKIDPDTGTLRHDFSDPEWSTRFLGDLYQDLSEAAQKRFALLQTPEFVEEFILDRTLNPAIAEFGYREVRLIDPTCGSGHFLLGGFARLLECWQKNEPGRNARDAVQQALNGIYGVDLNPFAVAISRFRLLIAALKACAETSLAEAPNFRFNLAAGDSLLHGPRLGHGQLALGGEAENLGRGALAHAFASEDLPDLNRILGQRYHAVVGNPPYITVKDAALNAAYRARYVTCHMKYSLGVPFTERFFELAIPGSEREPTGYVGMITTNSFMKREFGRKLIEDFLPRIDLSHVIDTSGAYIPGHGTPTVILFGRDRPPLTSVVRTLMGIKGEPSTPDNPAQGLVWRAIVEQVDVAGSESAFVSVADTPRATFARHPWSIGGGGAADLKDVIEEGRARLESLSESVGITSFTLEDDVFIRDTRAYRRAGVSASLLRPMVTGDEVRDWTRADGDVALFPYDCDFQPIDLRVESSALRAMWRYRSNLSNNKMFGQQTKTDAGLKWWEFGRLTSSKLRTPLTITFAFVATHNHFVLDRGGKVFKQTAPVIKLPAGTSDAEHLSLLGLLNSSVACFWLKQVCAAKHIGDPAFQRFEYDGTKLSQFPLVKEQPLVLAQTLDRLAQELAATSPSALVHRALPLRATLDGARAATESLRQQMIATQEELDWRCYQLYGLTQTELTHPQPPEIALGERAFEIVLARSIAAGQAGTTWFARHGSTPITELPAHWPADYRRVVEARIALIESDKFIGLIERPEYKRRWASSAWAEQEQTALSGWLLDRLESSLKAAAADTPSLTSTNKLADRLRSDTDFMQVAELYAGRSDFDVALLVANLVAGEAVPVLPVLRYSEAGLRKRAEWERTWDLQRREDAVDAETADESERRRRKTAEIGDIPVPPKYKSTDFQKTDYWRLRGGLDVPKERFVSFPHCSRDADGSLLIAWAGLNPLQLGTAIATWYLGMKDNEGWHAERLKPLLAAIAELVPWIKQWHNDPDAEHGTRMGDYLDGFVDEEARGLAVTRDAVVGWQPPATPVRRGRRRIEG
ncbi:MAG TPA: BREX-2 system adenine-specific DNA-methyltransferase PglX [Candidatus Accumulibacter phosphatis]|nr:MAG: Type I restriction-modification system methyltransferase subunit [Candidatus Accumulibacter sp. SK-11]HAY27855.1 BREX-2 system adenine-specific DNA-methyltransferase PglX [Accumulibacter sp.]HCN68734.1 BREX-2 system adenine-specific DNA-methyltransferase PglX [Accumulibacter sp.]HRL75614.1 BREX-2 system adenine-specific DNA-methyltransferase PglX [Candidatus Accumulibacter phosphatis]HRQ95945.1 BREX-2 system adenine-specific DNA-methyltransferase PglX [Candidatus Accumulibacter phosphat